MIFTVFKKELLETLRDRRTLIAMVFIPILIFPLVLGVMTTVTSSFEAEQRAQRYNIGVVGDGAHHLFLKLLKQVPEHLGSKHIIPLSDTNEVRKLVREDSLQIAYYIPSSFDEFEQEGRMNTIQVFYEETNLGAKQRSELYLNHVKDKLLMNRLAKRAIDTELIHPFEAAYTNLASDKEVIGKLVGGFIPYLFIIFGFIGCMYPAIDLFTGEKERKTLETLLTAPVSRWKILTGKMGVVVLSGVAAASFALLGLFLALEVFELVDDPRLQAVIRSILSVKFILMLYLLLIPLTVFFAGIMIPITASAKTFKEAQSILTPVNFVVIFPALVGFLPGVELNIITSLIPVVNTVLATKELIAETLDPFLLLLTYLSTFIFALLSVIISYRQFGKEDNILI